MRNYIKQSQNGRLFSQITLRGLQVLQLIGESTKPISLTEIAHELNTNAATVTRICYTLSELGFINRLEAKRFVISPKSLSLGYSYLNGLNWYKCRAKTETLKEAV